MGCRTYARGLILWPSLSPDTMNHRSLLTWLPASRPLGKVEIAMRKKLPLPQGWAIDREGNPAIQPSEMLNEGALLPLGSDRDHGGHKGYCLAVMVDVLSCVLSGANWGPFGIPFVIDQEMPKRSVGKGIGHFFGAMSIDAFIDPLEFKKQIDDYIRVFRATKPAPGTQGPLDPWRPRTRTGENPKQGRYSSRSTSRRRLKRYS